MSTNFNFTPGQKAMISSFNCYCVEYLVIGGIAVRTYEENRFTQVVQK